MSCLIPGSLAYFAFACLGSVARDAPVSASLMLAPRLPACLVPASVPAWCLPPRLPEQFQATTIQVSDNRGPERYASRTSVVHT